MPHKNIAIDTAVLGIITVIVIGLWLPFGFKTTGIVEEWVMLERIMRNGPVFFINPADGLYSAFAMRPMAMAHWSLVQIVSPDNPFLVVNIIYILLSISRAFLVYLIVKQLLPKHTAVAFAVAILFFIHPADTGWFTMRAYGSQVSLVFYLLATYSLLRLYEEFRWWVMGLMMVSLVISLFVKETTYSMVAFTPILLIWKASGIKWDVIKSTAIWYITPLLTGLYSIYVMLTISNDTLYQTGRTYHIGMQYLEKQLYAYRRFFQISWLEIELDTTYIIPAIILGSIIFATLLYLSHNTGHESLRLSRYLWLFAAGIVFIFAGSLLYGLVYDLQRITFRTYYNGAFGAALCTIIVLYLIFWRIRAVFSVVATLILTAAMFNGFQQFEHYQDIALQQQDFYAQVVEQVPSVEGNQTLIIHDDIEYTLQGEIFNQNQLKAALRIVYQNPGLNSVICYESDSGSYAYLRGSGGLTPGPCPVSDTAIVLEYTFQDGMMLISDSDLPEASPPVLFQCWPIEDCIESLSERIPEAPLTMEFDATEDITGMGWSSPREANGHTFIWGQEDETTLAFSIPDDTDYYMRFLLRNPGADEDGPGILVNGTPVPLNAMSRVEFEAVIPMELLHPETDVITFVTDEMWIREGGIPLAFAIDALTLEPVTDN